MQKVEIFIGSPRKRGNTNSLAEILENSFDKRKIISEISYLYNYEIKPCNDCRACKIDEMKCLLDDDMEAIYTRFEKSEIIIIGTPIYWFGPSAKTKLMLDRLRPYFYNKRLNGKKAVLLLPAGTGETDCDLTIEMFRRSFEVLGVDLISVVTAKAYNVKEVENDKKAIDSILKLSKQINEAV
jgi:multimeric flavodoxin WrbA